MDSNETRWTINPFDLFKNEKDNTFDKYNDLNIDELDVFLPDNNNGNGTIHHNNENNKENENHNFSTSNQNIPMTPIAIETNSNLYVYNNDDIDKKNQSNNILLNSGNNSGQEILDSSGIVNPLVWDELLSDCVNSDSLASASLNNTVNNINNLNQEAEIFDDLNKMDQQLLEQQEHLNIEIQKQKKRSMLLEKKLKQTQLQQQQLRKFLKEQQSLNSMRFVLGDITHSSRLNNTPKKKIKEFNISKSTNNSPIKKIHSTKLSFTSPIYSINHNNTGSNNGSPKRRQYIFKNNISDNDSTKQKFQKVKDKNLKINFTTTLTPRDQNNFITDSALSSPVRLSLNRSSAESPSREYFDRGSPVLGVNLKTNLDINRNLVSLQPLTNDSLNRSPIYNANNKESNLLDDLPTTFQDTPIRTKNYISPMDILIPPSEEDCDTKSSSKLTVTQNTTPVLYPSQVELKDIPEILESNELQEKFVEISKISSPSLSLKESSVKLQAPLTEELEQTEHQITPVSPSKGSRKFTKLSRDELDRYVKELPDKLFECLYPNCGKFFKRRYNIRTHIQTHLEDRPYSCDFPGCNKAFVRNHDLIRHKKTHLKKKYVCQCGKVYYKEELLRSHQSKMICVGGKQYDSNLTEQTLQCPSILSGDTTMEFNSLILDTLPSSNESYVKEDLNKENSYGTSVEYNLKSNSTFLPSK